MTAFTAGQKMIGVELKGLDCDEDEGTQMTGA